MSVQACNWMQALEGDVDTAHVFFLHARQEQTGDRGVGVFHQDRAPKLFLVESEAGLLYGASRRESEGHTYWRTTQFLMPVYTLFPPTDPAIQNLHIWVPIDDEHTLTWGMRWDPAKPIAQRSLIGGGVGKMLPPQQGKFYSSFWPEANPSNDYMIDREVQRTTSFTGIPTIRMQDSAMTTSMGTVFDRSKEHLGTTDAAIIKTRQRFLRAARALQADGTQPPGAVRPELYHVRSCVAVLPDEADWRTALEDWHMARTIELTPAQAAAPSR